MALFDFSKKKKFLEEEDRGLYYVSPILSLKRDKFSRTIWLDLKSENFSKKKRSLSFPIRRIDVGTDNDFEFGNDNYIRLNELLKLIPIPRLSLEEIYSILQNPEDIANDEIKQYVLSRNLKLSPAQDKDFKFILDITIKCEKIEINTLLNDGRYLLLLGNLDEDEKIENISSTEVLKFKKHPKITKEVFLECFGEVILDPKIKHETAVAMNLPEILRGDVT